jgi:hypothetical protein
VAIRSASRSTQRTRTGPLNDDLDQLNGHREEGQAAAVLRPSKSGLAHLRALAGNFWTARVMLSPTIIGRVIALVLIIVALS